MDKQDALIYARQLEVDRFVRKLARSAGYPDEHCINYWYDWMDGNTHLVVTATFGAGTNSAEVRIEGGDLVYQIGSSILYHADDYGQNINHYRHGQWVYRLRELADREYEAEQQRERDRAAARLAAEAANFAEIDF